jgi:hypothetical protein
MPPQSAGDRNLGIDTVRRPSPALTFIIVCWIVYSIVAAYALYQALLPLNRELLLILGGAAILPGAATFVFMRHARPKRFIAGSNC